ncbi:MAG: IMP cyclohydrolase [candidate division WOR-3 bacterium]
MTKHRALISVWDKTRIAEIGEALHNADYELIATSHTAEVLRAAGLPVIEISDYTGSPEILRGRVKTLHPKIAGGILTTRDDPTIEPIDVVVCNLYPFSDGLKQGLSHEALIELIDIGGVTLLRAAAKNYAYVAVVPSPRYYPEVLAELKTHGEVRLALRRRLARLAFEITSAYDAAIAAYFQTVNGNP